MNRPHLFLTLLLGAAVSLSFAVPAAHAQPVDSSLTLEDYVLNGVPDLRRKWAPTDLMKAAEALAGLGVTSSNQLPRIDSDRSKKLFERITSHDILKDLKKEKRAPEVRLEEAMELLSAFRTLAYIYLKGIQEGTPYDMEMALITGFALDLSIQTFILLDRVGHEIPPRDPDFSSRIEGIVTFKSGLNQLVAGSVQSLAQTRVYGPGARVQLARELQTYLPRVMPFVPPIQRTDMVMYLQRLGREEKNDLARGAIQRLVQNLPAE